MNPEMPNPFRRAPAPSRPPPVDSRDWGRLYVMAFVLFLVVGTMIYMKKIVDAASKTKGRPGPGQVDFKIRDTTGDVPQEPAPPGEKPVEPKKVVQVPPPPAEESLNFRELAAPFRDGEEKIGRETPEFINLVNVFLKSVTREGLARKIVPGLTAEKVYLDPAGQRGAALRVYGRLIQIYTERIDVTTPNNAVEFVYLGIMQEYPTNRTVLFYMGEKPLDPKTEKPIEFHSYRKGGDEFVTDWVEVEGIFLRQYVYPSQLEEEGRMVYAKAAALFVKSLRLAPKPQIADPRGSFVFIVGGLGVVIAVIVVVAGVMARKYSAGSLRMKMFQLRKHKEVQAPASPPPAGAQPPGPPPEAGAPGKGEGGAPAAGAPPPSQEPPPPPPAPAG